MGNNIFNLFNYKKMETLKNTKKLVIASLIISFLLIGAFVINTFFNTTFTQLTLIVLILAIYALIFTIHLQLQLLIRSYTNIYLEYQKNSKELHAVTKYAEESSDKLKRLEKGISDIQYEAMLFVDEFTKRENRPPSYKEVGNGLGVSKAVAWKRLRNYRHKMITNEK